MIDRIIEFSSERKFFVLILLSVLSIAGWYAMQEVPLDAIPDSDRVDLALALVRNGVLLASCDAPRIYADAEDEARGRNAALWSRVKVLEYKKRCAR